MYTNTVFFQEQLKNGTVTLQVLLNAIPYNSSKASSIYSTAVTHKNLLSYYLISHIIVILWAKCPWAYQLCCLPSN